MYCHLCGWLLCFICIIYFANYYHMITTYSFMARAVCYCLFYYKIEGTLYVYSTVAYYLETFVERSKLLSIASCQHNEYF